MPLLNAALPASFISPVPVPGLSAFSTVPQSKPGEICPKTYDYDTCTKTTPPTSNTLEPPPAASSSHKTPETNGQAPRPGNLPLDRGLNIDGAVEHALEHINDDSRIGYTVRRTARDGTINDLVALVTSIRDDLRR